MVKPRTRSITARAALLLALWASTARAGNDDGILIGGQAALSGGAVTAITGDGASAWYNPAGLARITQHTFDLSGSVYGVSLFTASNLFTLPDGRASNARAVDWQLIPSVLSYSRVLGPRVVGSFGVFVPSTSNVDLRAAVALRDGSRWTFGLDEVRNQYDYIASVGVRIDEALRVGFSLRGIYVSRENSAQVGTGMIGMGHPFTSASRHEVRGEYGLRCGFGVQWSPTPRLELGVSIQTPTLVGFREVRRDTVSGAYSEASPPSEFRSEHVDTLEKPWALGTPLNVRAGAAYAVGRARLLADASVSSSLDAAGSSLDRRLNGNVRLGALITHSDRLTYGAGVFSDRNGFRSRNANYLGVAGGARIATHYTIQEGERQLTFATTLAGRYAFGWGPIDGASITESMEVQRRGADVRVHELAFNLGGTVTF